MCLFLENSTVCLIVDAILVVCCRVGLPLWWVWLVVGGFCMADCVVRQWAAWLGPVLLGCPVGVVCFVWLLAGGFVLLVGVMFLRRV